MNNWLHIGLGSFHRAHQACYFNRLLNSGCTDWQIDAGNIRNDAEHTVQAMIRQGGKYMLETVTPQGEYAFEQICSIKKLIPWEPGLTSLIAEGAGADTKVIAFTVTEAGYYMDQQHHLIAANPQIAADLKGDCQTIYGTITKILARRSAEGRGPVTLLCCDNVRENGDNFLRGLTEFLTLSGNETVLDYLKENTTCPNTMVDRITPRPSPELPAEIKAKTGIECAAPVMSAAFMQPVIDDRFAAGRPGLETVGALLVDSVLPYEDAKLRILNASHSCLAWAGVLKGHNFVFECARDPELFKLAYDYVTNGVIPALGDNGIDLESYRDVVLDRFCSDHLRDTLQRICQDSTSKLATFILPTLCDCYAKGIDPKDTVMLPALYFLFLEKLEAGKVPFEYQDGTFDAAWTHEALSSADPIAAYAANPALFGAIAGKAEFVADLKAMVASARAQFGC